jgi:hypothetical protein
MDPHKATGKRSHSILVTFLGSFAATTIAVFGMVLLSRGSTTASYGWTMFIILPMAIGLLAASFTGSMRATVASVLIAILVCFAFLLSVGMEGVVCILMAFPLFFVFGLVGVLIGAIISRLARKDSSRRSNMVLLPLIGLSSIFGAEQIEDRLVAGDRVETVTTTRAVLGTPEQVWAKIVSIDEVSGTKPFLLRIGLPVPTSCTMEGSGVGARRVCHFETGLIEEEVTNWEPGHRLDLRIIRTTLPGRHWLQFKSASYELERLSLTETRLTRTTTISTKLRPGWYWRYLEAMGVQAETSLFVRFGLLSAQCASDLRSTRDAATKALEQI